MLYYNWDKAPAFYDFDPSALMVPGDGSFWYDFGDWTTLFQDTAMTIPVTAAGQVIAAVRDKGPNGYHLFQGSNGNRPVAAIVGGFKCAEFTAANQNYLITGTDVSIAFAVCHGYLIFSTKTNGNFMRLLSWSDTSTDTTGASALAVHTGDTAGWFGVRARAAALETRFPGTGVSPLGLYEYEINGANALVAKDSVGGDISDATAGGNTAFPVKKIIVGVMSSANAPSTTAPLDGHVYSMVHVGKVPSTNENNKTKAWLNQYRF